MKLIFNFVIILLFSCSSFGQSERIDTLQITISNDSLDIPKLFQLGDKRYDRQYKVLSKLYPNSLLDIHFDKTYKAGEHWRDIIKTIDDYAIEHNIDINGLKIWMHIFFSENGEIDYLGYYFKPNSKIKDQEMLKDLISKSLNQYKYHEKLNGKGNHYSGAGFPIFRH